jgi:pimeloyl-ACP methyl ester carboxylesterase
MNSPRKNWKIALGGVAAAGVVGAAVIASGQAASAAPPSASASGFAAARSHSAAPKPTVVLVHGAFADASSWNGVVARLESAGYPVIAPADPLRGIPTDATYIASVLKSITGPIILVGHSYGGAVISTAAAGNPNVKALVYVAALMPDTGEKLSDLMAKFPGSEVPTALNEVPYTNADGTTGTDVYLQTDKFRAVFAADLPAQQAQVMAAEQRPFDAAGLNYTVTAAAWHTIPVYGVYGSADEANPPALAQWELERAHAREIIDVPGASHVVMISHPGVVTKLIEDAANANG